MTLSINKSTLLSEANRYLIKHPTRALAEGTYAQYSKEYLRITKNCSSINEVIKRICETNKISTFFKRKYAVQAILSEKIQGLVSKAAADNDANQEVLAALRKLLNFASKLGELKSCQIEDKVPRKSKRQDLKGLPSDWRERLLDRMIGSTNYIPALAMAACGCRPEELRRGIEVTMDANVLSIRVSGAKLGELKGQPQRSISYGLPSNNAIVSDLAQIAQLAGGRITISIDNPNSFSSAITYYGHQTFPTKRKAITPYCLRHAFASDVKKSLGDNDDVSRALGHQVDETRTRYGQAQIGKPGGLEPNSISATHDIRHVKTPVPDSTTTPTV